MLLFVRASFYFRQTTTVPDHASVPLTNAQNENKMLCMMTPSSCRPNRPHTLASGAQLSFHKGLVVDATEMGTIPELPEACAIVGGGVIAVEYATVLASLGVEVTLLCKAEVRVVIIVFSGGFAAMFFFANGLTNSELVSSGGFILEACLPLVKQTPEK